MNEPAVACDDRAAEISALCAALRRIAAERMRGLSIVNPALGVEAVGFRPWHGRLLGIVVTPWFMNLVLLPSPADDWNALETGAHQRWALPAGEYDFTVARLDGVRAHQSCALFTTVVDFPDQQSARDVAEQIMATVLRPAAPAPTTSHAVSRRDLLRRSLGA